MIDSNKVNSFILSPSACKCDGPFLAFAYSLLFSTSHGILTKEIWNFPLNPLIPAWSFSESLTSNLVFLNIFLLLQSNGDAIVKSTEGCSALYSIPGLC